jgi:O-antigen/teichoic acid export membrane protein
VNAPPNSQISHTESIASVSRDEVGQSARSGALWSATQIVGRNGLSIIATAILARMLSPDDYGLLGMVTTLTALLLVFSDMGLSWATIQRRELSVPQLSNLFWINTAAGIILCGVCVACGPLIKAFYGRPELEAVTAVLGLSFIFGGLSAQPFALMRRRMRYREIAQIEIIAVAVAVVFAVLAAGAGLGYWALVLQAVMTQLVRAALALPRSRLQIMRLRRGVGTRSLLQFGGLLAISGFLIYVARTADNVLVGRVLGAHELGYYDRAYFLMLLPSFIATGVLTHLMVSSLSAFQRDPAGFGQAYRRAVRMVAFVGCPMALGLALTASEIVDMVYGEKWSRVVPLLMWLSIAGVTQPVYNTTGWLFTASGKARDYLLLTCSNAVVLVTTFAITVSHGVDAVAAAYGLIMGIVLLWPALWWAHKAAGIRLVDTLRTLVPVGLACASMGVAVVAAGAFCVYVGADWRLTLSAKLTVGVASYAAASWWLLPSMLRLDMAPMLPRAIAKILERKRQ